LVAECNIAFHSGVSYWSGVDGLNKNSIGIEFLNPDPDNLDFSDLQLKSGIKLCQDIKKRYNIKNQNIVGHLDIAYFCQEDKFGYLGRKEDPSFRFDWQKFYDNDVGEKLDKDIFDLIEKLDNIKLLKIRLSQYGYKINKIDNNLDGQLRSVIDIIKYKYLNNPKKAKI
jgi:N-acetyl-anhydromuramyl-L-alanine amidase AmpD